MEEIYACIRIYSISTGFFVTIAIKWPKNNRYILFEFCSDLDLEISRSNDKLSMALECLLRFAWNKSSAKTMVDSFHIWPLASPVTLAMDFQGQILKLSYFLNIWPHPKNIKECEFFGWINILFVNNVWSTFYFCYMLQCRPDVTFLSMVTLVWSYHDWDGDCVYLRHSTSLGAVFGFTSCTHRPYMEF